MTHSFKEYSVGITSVVVVTLITWLMVSFAVFGEFPLVGHADSDRIQYKAGNYQLGIEFDPTSPRVGQNHLTIGVRDVQGMNLVGASLRVVLEKPAGDQAHATAASDRFVEFPVIEQSAGLFRSSVALPSEGEWPLLIEVKSEAGGHADLALNLSTGEPGIKLISATKEGRIRYTCPMHPSISQSEPGSCPLCGFTDLGQ